MYNDIDWTKKDKATICDTNPREVSEYAESLQKFIGHSSVQEMKKKWYGAAAQKPECAWNAAAEHMMLNFAESGHPGFIGTSPLARGALKSKRAGNFLFVTMQKFRIYAGDKFKCFIQNLSWFRATS